jgi:threonine/homoserine/homoserine lactone efflux protein
LFGLGDFLMSSRFQIFLYIVGVAVLSYLLYHTVREYRRHIPSNDPSHDLKNNSHRIGFLTGFTLAITNPGIVIWWIVGFKIFVDFEVVASVTMPLKLAFVLSGASGLMGYLVLLIMIIHRIHRNISDSVFRKMNLALIVVLVAVVLYFIYKVITCVIGYVS